MKTFFKKTALLLTIGLLGACSISQATPTPVPPTVTPTAALAVPAGFTENQAKTLASLKQVDDHPLYTMTYYGDYAPPRTSSLPAVPQTDPTRGWACSLFTVLLDQDHLLYGRNFDWEFSPALLLFTDPPDGYASVSMVDIAYLGFNQQTASTLMEVPLEERKALLDAPQLPFDGMNEYGLAIGMAAVPPGDMQADPSRERMNSIGIIREILDHARDVEEAVSLIRHYDIVTVGTPIHYLIADAKGKAVLVEFYQGKMHVFENEQPWHSATNFLRSAVEDPKGQCWRYDKLNARLSETQGKLDANAALQLLSEVAQGSTQWSMVYQMRRGEVHVAMDRDYKNVLIFRTADYYPK